MINKKTFVKELSQKTGFTQKDLSDVLSYTGQLICQYAKAHETIKPIDGFTFEGKISPSRDARNPMTGETIKVPEKNKIVCRFSRAVKEAIQ